MLLTKNICDLGDENSAEQSKRCPQIDYIW